MIPLAFVLPILGMSRVPTDSEFLPLTVGNKWSYVSSDGHEVAETIRGATDVRGADGQIIATAAAVAAADGSEFFYVPSNNGVVRVYDPPTQLPGPDRVTWVLRFPLLLGTHWESWTPAGKVEFRVTDRRSVTAPDGTVTDGVRVDFVSLPEPIFSGHIWYARGIGPTEVVEGDYTRKLLGYRRGDGPAIPLATHIEGLEPPRVAESWRFGKKAWIAVVLTLAMAAGIAVLPRLRHPPRPGRWERMADPVQVKDEGLLTVQAARFEASVAEHPRWADLRCQLGEVYLKMGRTKESIDQFRVALEVNPKYVEAALGLTRACLKAGDSAGARAAIEPFAERHPDYADVQNLLGEALAGSGDRAGALARFQKALEINPTFQAAAENLQRWSGHA